MKIKKIVPKKSHKKKKGFTLLEILAVIIILGVISLIAIPILKNVIKDAEKGVFQRTVENISEAIMNTCQVEKIHGENITTSYVIKDGTISPSLDIKGKLPDSGTINVDIISCDVEFEDRRKNDLIAKKILNSNDIIISDIITSDRHIELPTKDGDPVYLDPTDLKKDCNEDNSSESTGTKTGCMKWYAFNVSEESEKIYLILGHNTTTSVKWSSGVASAGPKEVLAKLKADTDNWETPFIENNYTVKITSPSVNYEVKYNTDQYKFKARLITAEEIAHIVGADKIDTLNWKISDRTNTGSTHFYFDGKGTGYSGWFYQVANPTNKSKYSWLFNNLYDCLKYGCDVQDNTLYLYDGVNSYNMCGYWTPSITCSEIISNVWTVYGTGTLDTRTAAGYKSIGIRPVIEIPKDAFIG